MSLGPPGTQVLSLFGLCLLLVCFLLFCLSLLCSLSLPSWFPFFVFLLFLLLAAPAGVWFGIDFVEGFIRNQLIALTPWRGFVCGYLDPCPLLAASSHTQVFPPDRHPCACVWQLFLMS